MFSLSYRLTWRSLQVSFGEYVSQLDVVLDVAEFHFRFAAGFKIRNDGFDHGGEILNCLDFR